MPCCVQFLCETHTRYLFARNLAAVGVCTAWLQFIIIFGRMPLKGGNFSVMFFSVIQEIFSYVIAMVFMVFGFGLAFLVTHQCFPKNPFSSLFNPFRYEDKGPLMILLELETNLCED